MEDHRHTWESSLKGSFGCRSPYLRRSCGQLPLVVGAEQLAELVSIMSLRQAMPSLSQLDAASLSLLKQTLEHTETSSRYSKTCFCLTRPTTE